MTIEQLRHARHAVALDGGMKAWRESGDPRTTGREP